MDPGAVISFSVIIFEMCIGMFSGLFIVGTILKDIFKGQRMSTGDKIILSLSCSNICLLIMTFTSASASYFPFNPDVYTVCTINALVFYGRTSCSWLTTCLCFFYFIKITQLKSSFLSLLKKKIDVLIPWMILVIEALCLGSSFFSEMTHVPPQESSNISVSFLFNTLGDNSHPGRTILYVSMFVSLLISVVITARNALSLIVHICRTGKNVTPSGRTNVKVQRVVKTMVQLLALYFFSYLISVIAYCLKDLITHYRYVFQVAQFFFGPVQSILLILGNPRYKEDIHHTMCICSRVCTLQS
ncbi:PREDICTED: taste receptor type 2 member 8-like [Nanorana parkeri]|uniref:taste receptor type 2 member 8-like n=1 Tax=Nanorana parkeri TaxID=125878 RepID=UPI0008543742|nr:PREDICTED: taste receptor type 2 member 8-like [Nanorana parkeri]